MSSSSNEGDGLLTIAVMLVFFLLGMVLSRGCKTVFSQPELGMDVIVTTTLIPESLSTDVNTTETIEMIGVSTFQLSYESPVYFDITVNGAEGELELWVDGDFIMTVTEDTVAANITRVGSVLLVCDPSTNQGGSGLTNQIDIGNSVNHSCPN